MHRLSRRDFEERFPALEDIDEARRWCMVEPELAAAVLLDQAAREHATPTAKVVRGGEEPRVQQLLEDVAAREPFALERAYRAKASEQSAVVGALMALVLVSPPLARWAAGAFLAALEPLAAPAAKRRRVSASAGLSAAPEEDLVGDWVSAVFPGSDDGAFLWLSSFLDRRLDDVADFALEIVQTLLGLAERSLFASDALLAIIVHLQEGRSARFADAIPVLALPSTPLGMALARYLAMRGPPATAGSLLCEYLLQGDLELVGGDADARRSTEDGDALGAEDNYEDDCKLVKLWWDMPDEAQMFCIRKWYGMLDALPTAAVFMSVERLLGLSESMDRETLRELSSQWRRLVPLLDRGSVQLTDLVRTLLEDVVVENIDSVYDVHPFVRVAVDRFWQQLFDATPEDAVARVTERAVVNLQASKRLVTCTVDQHGVVACAMAVDHLLDLLFAASSAEGRTATSFGGFLPETSLLPEQPLDVACERAPDALSVSVDVVRHNMMHVVDVMARMQRIGGPAFDEALDIGLQRRIVPSVLPEPTRRRQVLPKGNLTSYDRQIMHAFLVNPILIHLLDLLAESESFASSMRGLTASLLASCICHWSKDVAVVDATTSPIYELTVRLVHLLVRANLLDAGLARCTDAFGARLPHAAIANVLLAFWDSAFASPPLSILAAAERCAAVLVKDLPASRYCLADVLLLLNRLRRAPADDDAKL